MTAAFLDENLPDGTRLRPGTKFIKYWKMRNTGTISWNADTKVNNSTIVQSTVFSWGHLNKKNVSSWEHKCVQQISWIMPGGLGDTQN